MDVPTSRIEVPRESKQQRTRNGLVSAMIAFGLWGFLPIYFIVLKEVSSFEVLAHRIIWSVPFGAAIIHARRQWPEVVRALTHVKMRVTLLTSAIFIAGNWLTYIWAVQNEQIFQASLGYYINPLLFAVVGVFFLDERLRSPQMVAVALAAIGVAVLTISGGRFPAVALTLAGSFTVYGVIRKHVVIGGMPGLFVETILLAPFGIAYLAWLMMHDAAAFGAGGMATSAMLLLAGPITVVPLLFFALAARRLDLSTLGMLQFIGPTLQFLIGVVNGETLTTAHVICFSCIWTAVGLFSWDAWRSRRQPAMVN